MIKFIDSILGYEFTSALPRGTLEHNKLFSNLLWNIFVLQFQGRLKKVLCGLLLIVVKIWCYKLFLLWIIVQNVGAVHITRRWHALLVPERYFEIQLGFDLRGTAGRSWLLGAVMNGWSLEILKNLFVTIFRSSFMKISC